MLFLIFSRPNRDAARAAMQAMHGVLTALRAQGSSTGLDGSIVTMAERNRLTGMAAWQALERRYGIDP